MLPHHVAHDPLKIDIAALRPGGHHAVAQHNGAVGDLQRLLQMMGDINDGDALAGEIADHLKQHPDFGGAQSRGRFIHDQDLRIYRQRPGNLHNLLLAETQVLDRRQRIDILFERRHQVPGQPCLFVVVNAGSPHDFASHEDVVTDIHIGREIQLLMNNGDTAAARLGGGVK